MEFGGGTTIFDGLSFARESVDMKTPVCSTSVFVRLMSSVRMLAMS